MECRCRRRLALLLVLHALLGLCGGVLSAADALPLAQAGLARGVEEPAAAELGWANAGGGGGGAARAEPFAFEDAADGADGEDAEATASAEEEGEQATGDAEATPELGEDLMGEEEEEEKKEEDTGAEATPAEEEGMGAEAVAVTVAAPEVEATPEAATEEGEEEGEGDDRDVAPTTLPATVPATVPATTTTELITTTAAEAATTTNIATTTAAAAAAAVAATTTVVIDTTTTTSTTPSSTATTATAAASAEPAGVEFNVLASGVPIQTQADVDAFGQVVARLAEEKAGVPVRVTAVHIVDQNIQPDTERQASLSVHQASVREGEGRSADTVDVLVELLVCETDCDGNDNGKGKNGTGDIKAKREAAVAGKGKLESWVDKGEYQKEVEEAGYDGVRMEVKAGGDAAVGLGGDNNAAGESSGAGASTTGGYGASPSISLGSALGIATGAVAVLAVVAIVGVWAARGVGSRRTREGARGDGDGGADGHGGGGMGGVSGTLPLTQDDDCTGMESDFAWEEGERELDAVALETPVHAVRPSDATSYISASSAGLLDEESYGRDQIFGEVHVGGGVVVERLGERPRKELARMEDAPRYADRERSNNPYTF